MKEFSSKKTPNFTAFIVSFSLKTFKMLMGALTIVNITCKIEPVVFLPDFNIIHFFTVLQSL